MKSIVSSFMQMLHCVMHDGMLFLSCFAPLLCGSLFKFGIPAGEKLLTGYFEQSGILLPYYVLFDLFLSMITPMMFSFVAAMVILEETDVHIVGYLSVTPLGKRGYLISRLGIPALVSVVITLLVLSIFSLTSIRLGTLLVIAIVGTAQGLITALMIISFSSNKLEGMAVTKLSSLMLLGIVGPFFISGNMEYLLSPLPAFWMAKIMQQNSLLNALVAFVISLLWIAALSKKFYRKVSL